MRVVSPDSTLEETVSGVRGKVSKHLLEHLEATLAHGSRSTGEKKGVEVCSVLDFITNGLERV